MNSKHGKQIVLIYVTQQKYNTKRVGSGPKTSLTTPLGPAQSQESERS
jgi:hypothetical protein